MKLDGEIINERKRIMGIFADSIAVTPLIPTDITDHGYWIEKVTRGTIREAGTIEDCCRRFEKTFRTPDVFFEWID